MFQFDIEFLERLDKNEISLKTPIKITFHILFVHHYLHQVRLHKMNENLIKPVISLYASLFVFVCYTLKQRGLFEDTDHKDLPVRKRKPHESVMGSKLLILNGAPGRDRTCDLRLRRPTPYPLGHGRKTEQH